MNNPHGPGPMLPGAQGPSERHYLPDAPGRLGTGAVRYSPKCLEEIGSSEVPSP